MKTTEYTCDHCEKKYRNDAEIISFYAESGKLFYKNPHTSINQVKELSNFHDLHFCNQNCFINYFFNKES